MDLNKTLDGVCTFCTLLAYLSANVGLGVFVGGNFSAMSVGEGASVVEAQTVPVLQNVPFPSKLESMGNLANNWKRFRRVDEL